MEHLKDEYLFGTEELVFAKTRNVKSPTRGTNQSAGLDFYLPELDTQMFRDMKEKNPDQSFSVEYDIEGNQILRIPAHNRILIPSGIKVMIYKDTMLMAANKSGIATKKGLIFTAEIVDSDYQGEIHLGLYNTTDRDQTFKTGDKVMQFVHVPIILSQPEEVSIETYNKVCELANSQRGEGGFGSTGK